MLIERLNNIEDIIALQEEYHKTNGVCPFNVSNWTVSDFFREEMEQVFQHSTTSSPIDYLYSYSITSEIKENVMLKLGVSREHICNKTCIFFSNNSQAIVNVCNLLQKVKCRKVGILNPAYFSIDACMSSYGIRSVPFYTIRKEESYVIPLKEIVNENLDALWITSPIYSTGTTYEDKNLEKIEELLKTGILIIVDESFCIKGHELVRRFAAYRNFICIYSPHKAISFNSYKFSAIICNEEYEDFFDQWLDVLCGNLPQTTIAAIHHYLSDNYDICYNAFESFIRHAHEEVSLILKKFPNVSQDNTICGNLMTLYLNNLDFEQSKNLDFINDTINNTCAVFYPGYLNGFSKDMGFCFRINLALYSPDFIASLNRLLVYLSSDNI